ncbi:MAG: protein jag [Lachnospiraceae bacterium]|nr:protein jag [Lachnospiraceae bacterium]
MSERKTFMAASVDDAITEATLQLQIPSNKLGYEVIDKGAKGFLGIGARQAIIEAWEITDEDAAPAVVSENAEPVTEAPKQPEKAAPKKEVAVKKEEPKKEEKPAEATSEKVKTNENDAAHFEEGRKFLLDVFEKMDLKVNIEYSYNEEDNALEMNLEGDEMGVLIGKRGQTLDSLQYLTSLVVNRSGEHYIRVKLDTENYRERRKETLESLAKNIAYKVKRTRRSVSLEPMNPYERRIIHSALQSDNFVMTRSEGEEPYRHVVVFYKRNRNGEER